MNNINRPTTEQSIDGQSKISEGILDLESKNYSTQMMIQKTQQ